MDAGFSNSIRFRRRPPIGLAQLVFALGGLIASCAPGESQAQSPIVVSGGQLASVQIAGVPHVNQRPDFGGEACVEMFLRKLKVRLDQDGVFEQAGVDPVLGRGCEASELAGAVTNIGFRTGPFAFALGERDPSGRLNEEFVALHADLARGVPSVVCMRSEEDPPSQKCFRLVLGYDGQADEVLYHDPGVPHGTNLRISRSKFLRLWPLANESAPAQVIRLRLEPNHLIRPAIRTDRLTRADYAQHIRLLKPRIPQGFTLVFERPFVVLGNESPETVRKRVRNTVDWAVARLKRDFFDQNPREIIDIWLFEDGFTYEEFTQKLFGERPTTPYGFYSPRHHALVMNIATGGGTLVHEIVHPFIAANFPKCPSWFNEGLASLYEQAHDREGHIAGLTNWRLRGLHAAIRDRQLPSFEKLCSTTTREFYDVDRGTNYAQARYLCYYLQEHGLLVKFYRAFRRNVALDPTGVETLKSVLGEENLADFQKRWEKYVLKLDFEH
jgi:hypothetical protein